MRKILIIHNQYSILGGEDVAVENEKKLLSKYFTVDTLYFENIPNSFLLQIFYFLTNHNRESTKLLKSKIRNFQPDLVYVHNTWFKASLKIFKILEKNQIPILLKLHNFRYECTRYFFLKNHVKGNDFCQMCGVKKSKFKFLNIYFQDSLIKSLVIIWYGKKYFKILKNNNLKILVLTKFHMNFLLSLKFNPKKLFILHNPMNLIKESENLHNTHYFTYSGRVSAEKGVDDLIRAFLKSNINKSQLKIAGEGPLLENLKKKYELNQNIEFLGLVSNKQSQDLISNSKAVITATKLLEGQPMLLCEASSYGIPSIFPQQGGINEFYPSNTELSYDRNIEFELVNALNKLNDEVFLKKEGKNNKKFIEENFNDEQYIAAFKKIALNNE